MRFPVFTLCHVTRRSHELYNNEKMQQNATQCDRYSGIRRSDGPSPLPSAPAQPVMP